MLSKYRSSTPNRRTQAPSSPFDVSLLVRTLNETIELKQKAEISIATLLKNTEKKSDEHSVQIRELRMQLDKEISRISNELVSRINGHVQRLDTSFENAVQEMSDKVRKIPHLKGKDGDDGNDADETKITQSVINTMRDKFTAFSSATEQKFASLFNKLEETILKNLTDKLLKIISAETLKMQNDIRHLSSKIALGGVPSGGGMGNFTPFSLAGDGITTAFNLPAQPTQEGLAILAYYQGQWLQPVVHYSVSGKTITFTFTPDDNTTIEGLLIT